MKSSDGLARTILISETVIVILFGVLYSNHLGEKLVFLDEKAYHSLAVHLAQNGSYTLNDLRPCTYWPPGYPALMSVFVYLGFNETGLRIINFLALAGCLWIIFSMLKRYFGNTAGILGSILVFFYPVLFYVAGFLYPQTIFSLVFLTIIHFLFSDSKHKSIAFIVAGFAYGCLMLSIPLFTFNLLAILPLIYFWHRKLRVVFLFLIGAILILIPWNLRNYRVLGGFAFISTNSGENLLYGNNKNTTPNGGTTIDVSEYTSKAKEMNTLQRDAYYRQEAINYVLTHKAESIQMYFKKVLNYFNYKNELQTKHSPPRYGSLVMLASYSLFLSLLLIRLLLIYKIPFQKIEVVFYVLYLTSPFFDAICFVRIRHRIPMDFVLIAISGISAHCLLKYFSKNNPLQIAA